MADASAQGFPKARFDDLREIVLSRIGVFRTDFSQSSASIPPLRLELKSDAKPVHVKIRKYSDSQRKFLRKLVEKLLDAGLNYPNPTSKWSCAPHLVPKPGPAEWRFTVDLRHVNKSTYALNFPLLFIDAELDKAAGAQMFCEFDMTQGYWQLLLHKDSQESQSFVTPEGIYTLTRVLHGNLNTNSHLHAGLMCTMPPDLKEKLLVWVDDMAIAVKNVDDLLQYLTKLLDFCVSVNFKLHPIKCGLFKTLIVWCGRHISAEGVRFDSRHVSGLETTAIPTIASELLQFTSAMQWLRTSVPAFPQSYDHFWMPSNVHILSLANEPSGHFTKVH